MARHKFEKEYQGFYAAELQAAKQEAQKFTQVTGLPFTIDNARHALLTAADSAMIFFHNDCYSPNCNKFKKKFNDILDALPRESLQEVSELIETEVFAHLRLSYGIVVEWLTVEWQDL